MIIFEKSEWIVSVNADNTLDDLGKREADREGGGLKALTERCEQDAIPVCIQAELMEY